MKVATPASVDLQVEARGPYTRVAAFGLLLVGLTPLVYLAAIVVTGQISGEVAFLGVVAAVALAAAALVWRFGMWAKIVGIVACLGAAMMMFWSVFGLSYPASFADFVPGVMFPLGILLGIGGSVAAIVRRKHAASEASARSERRIVVGAVALLAVVAVVSGTLHVLGIERADAVAAAPDITMTMAGFEFDEEVYRLPAGEETVVLVRNDDAFVHHFTLPALGIDEVVRPGSSKIIRVTLDAGSYTLYCAPHADTSEPDPAEAGMAARIVAE